MSTYPHLEGSTFEDYAKKALETEEGIQEDIVDATQQQEERLSTPDVDWETRYKDLEKHNSRQAQELGTLRSENGRYQVAFDDYLLNPTPTEELKAQDKGPITSDDLFEHPEEVINRAVDSHPAIREAQEANEQRRRQVILDSKALFEERHPNYQETMSDPSFADWVKKSNTRIGLAQRSDQWDFEAADALFSLYEGEKALNGLTADQQASLQLENAELESAGIGEPPPEARFSRHEMRETMIAARKGDAKAERFLEVNLPKYRAALAAGQVTD